MSDSENNEALRVSVSELHNGPHRLAMEVPAAALDLTDREFRFADPVTVDVELTRGDARKVYMRGTVSVAAAADCARCTADAALTVNGRVAVMYENNPELLSIERQAFGDPDGAIAYFDGEQILTADALREALMVELPERVYCRPDCKGLCHVCGANLNDAPCKCSRDKKNDITENSNWKDALNAIKLNLK